MNIEKINSATVLPKLKGILQDDIEVLQGMLSTRAKDSETYALIESLVDAKDHILTMLPDSEGVDSVPTTGQHNSIEGYRVKNSTEIKDRVYLIGILLDIERSQKEFIKDVVRGEGLPNKIKDVIKEVYTIYLDITAQLERSKKTQQMGTIVI